jgi:hypothetical protein
MAQQNLSDADTGPQAKTKIQANFDELYASKVAVAARLLYDIATERLTIGAGQNNAVQFYERTISEAIGVLTMRAATANTPTAWDVQPNGTPASALKAWIHVLNSDLPRTDDPNWQACLVGVSADACFVGADFSGTGTRLNLSLGGNQIRFLNDATGKPGNVQYGRLDSGGFTLGSDSANYTKLGTAGLLFSSDKTISWSATGLSSDTKDCGVQRVSAGVVATTLGTSGTRGVHAAAAFRCAPLAAAPSSPSNGDIVYADGTNWNPGSGEGFYGRQAGAWVKL